MKMPWHDKTGLTKLAAIFATTLGIASGLCGANFAAVIKFVPLAGPAPPPGNARWPGQVFIIAGFMELTVIAISVGALIVIGLAAITRAVKNHFTHN